LKLINEPKETPKSEKEKETENKLPKEEED
jgi:hypothetical protein